MRIIILLPLACLASISKAQPVSQQDLEACALIERSLQRLDCYEALTGRGRIMEAPEPDSEPQVAGEPLVAGEMPAAETAVAPVPGSESQMADVPLAAGETPAVGETPVAEPVAPESGAQPPAPPRETSPPAPPIELEPAVTEFGREHLPDAEEVEERPPDSIVAAVREVTEGARGNLYFHLDNGQVWRQIEARFVPYPRNEPFEVEINRGMLGEFRLRVEGRGRMVRIRRVE